MGDSQLLEQFATDLPEPYDFRQDLIHFNTAVTSSSESKLKQEPTLAITASFARDT